MRSSYSAGFTLIELLVICAILVVVSGVILANNTAFGGAVLLESMAYDMALSMREAQVYGVSVARFGSGIYSAGYGMHFDTGSPATYVLFADAVNANGLYDQGEIVSSTDFQRGYRVVSLCATQTDATEVCGYTRLDVSFLRPEPDAWISADGSSCILLSSACKEGARIVLQSPRGDQTSVVVEANGQIYVKKI
ncbi:prepilin-type N-terminal cleavage/methylation domain-containing protein [Candidatus Kaiserbacteria bacterium]|nr:prepilin-type N-terminal cleavage/methylation domain-containing protein [Candidatus Kaiserbacteria bacterium]